MTSSKIQRLKGTRDIYGEDALRFQRIEAAARKVFNLFGFSELRTPILEEKQLFTRGLGTETDVVQKEMYEFEDRSKTEVAMRPEGTAGVVRAYLENELDKKEGFCKFYYIGPMFRSERPQAGRLRQFHQIGVEQLGIRSPYSDAETILCLIAFLDEIGIKNYEVRLNNLGSLQERADYKKILTDYFRPLNGSLCEDCKRRLEKNVIRILDCKVGSCIALVQKAPRMDQFFSEETKLHFKSTLEVLNEHKVRFQLDPYMVRGLDYYTNTVFEVTHGDLGAQNALAAGGRYDTLVEAFGGAPAGAVGFAAGVERLTMCLAPDSGAKTYEESFYMVALGEAAFQRALDLLFQLRSSGIKALMNFAAASLKSQMRNADKNRCKYALILGDTELDKGVFTLKNLEVGIQKEFLLNDVVQVCLDPDKFSIARG